MTSNLRAAMLAGAATGLRSTVSLATLINRKAAGLPSWLAGRRATVAAPIALTGELVVDKLPSTPSRLEPGPLAARVIFAALAGAVIARGADQSLLPAAVIASAAALASARVGHDLRAALADRMLPCAVAAGEDGLALALAGAAADAVR